MTGTRVLLTNSQGQRKPKERSIQAFLSGLLLLCFGISACVPIYRPDPQSNWEYADLRILEEADTLDGNLDLIALYSRMAGPDFQVRLDLFDLMPDTQADVYLALDTAPGGTRALPFEAEAEIDWDILLVMRQASPPFAYSPSSADSTDFPIHPNLIPRLIRFPWLDSLVVSMNASTISALDYGISVEAFILPEGGTLPADRLKPSRTDSLPPGRANLLLAFWNSFPAYTPAQALRRWDGAHTGPFGEHHGLHVLLQNVRRYRTPVALLDLKNPIWLSALDLVGGIPDIQNLTRQGLVILPDVLPGSPSFPYFPIGLPEWATDQALFDSRTTAAEFNLPASQLLYAPQLLQAIPAGYSLIFSSSNPGGSTRWQDARLLPIPSNAAVQSATVEGLAPEIRRILLTNALRDSLDPQEDRLLILGGSLPDSAFGDPQASQASLLYISAHPWMHALQLDELSALSPNLIIDLPPGPLGQPGSSQGAQTPPFSTLLTNIPQPDEDHPINGVVWQAALALYTPLPPEPPNLAMLRATYSNQVGFLQFASTWANSPQPIQVCNVDLDQDGLPECLFATAESLAIFDRLGGRLLALFHISNSRVHQMIGPTNQFLIGQADPSTWQLADGEAADPGGMPGAFIDGSPPWSLYTAEFSDRSLTLSAPAGVLVKTFTIIPGGMRVEYQIDTPITTRIPLVLDPWQRFSPGWGERYQAQQLPDGWIWQIANGPRMKVQSSATTRLYPFNASLPQLRSFEDPNYAYPPGHYLTFPLALVEIQAAQDFQVEITFTEN